MSMIKKDLLALLIVCMLFLIMAVLPISANAHKMSESGRKQVQFSLQQNEIDLINTLAEKAGLNKSRFIVDCVKAWQEAHRE